MKKDVIKKKLFNVNKWVQDARDRKDWKTYHEAVEEYMRLLKFLKAAE